MVTLENITTRAGENINIVEESAPAYHEIGTILLQDRHGRRVEVIEIDERGRSMSIMRVIYRQWIAEDERHSWAKLTDCFRQCHLIDLAHRIEQHFGLPSPLPLNECTYILSVCYTNVRDLKTQVVASFINVLLVW